MDKTQIAPILFLDIDGVLIHWSWVRSGNDPAKFDPNCVSQLNRIIQQTGCQLVIASSWRMNHTKDQLRKKFAQENIVGEILDYTPVLQEQSSSGLVIQKARGCEIAAWLERNPPSRPFAILDDDKDMEHLLPYLHRTTFDFGLTREIADQLIQSLQNAL